jgi:methylenetetrahydrofolate reductase (NADPH)
MFEPGRAISRWGASVSAHARDPRQGPALLRVVERASKAALFDCRDCGDCSLPEIAYLCPESQCAKNQRNGPCGGTRDGQCEVDGFGDCIWLRAYERRAHDGDADHLLDHAPVVQDQGLRGTSSWANHWLGRDHTSRPAEPAATADPPAAPPLALEGRQPTTATK